MSKNYKISSGYRLRVGNYRVIFDVNGLIVDIIDVGNRGQIYKGCESSCLI
ncbi:MAG: type II toxin-antitoxin system RelE family toxin [Blautia wexlerae]